MVGIRFVVGLIVMGLLTPGLIGYLLELRDPADLLTVSVCCFSAWAVGDLIATILAKKKAVTGSSRRMIETYLSGSDDRSDD